jgi:hypothetical protein
VAHKNTNTLAKMKTLRITTLLLYILNRDCIAETNFLQVDFLSDDALLSSSILKTKTENRKLQMAPNGALLPTKSPTFKPNRPPSPPTRPPTKPIPCKLCRDGQYPGDLTQTIILNGEEKTCKAWYNLGDLTNVVGKDQCDYLRSLGEMVCLCKEGGPTEENNCTLCEDGSKLTKPKKKVFEGIACATIQVTAKQADKKDCVKYQGAIGPYCNCKNPKSRKKVCRLCKEGLLPFPQRVVKGATCLQHEFKATMSNNCDAAVKELREDCCSKA